MRSGRVSASLLIALASGLLLVPAKTLAAQDPRAGSISCVVTGVVTANRMPLPGVLISLMSADGQRTAVTSSTPDGKFSLKALAAGAYSLTAELSMFATTAHPISLDTSSCLAQVDVTMTLASRASSATPASGEPTAAASAPDVSPDRRGQRSAAAGQDRRGSRGRQGGGPRQAFQNLALRAAEGDTAGRDEADVDLDLAAAEALLPPGFSADTSTESITSIGAPQASDSLFGRGDPGERILENGGGGPFAPQGRTPLGAAGRDGGGGARLEGIGGPGGSGDGPVRFARAPNTRLRGSIFESTDSSVLDAPPYALNGQPTPKPSYVQLRFGLTIGGPLPIPKLFDPSRSFFFLNYAGNHSRNPYDQYSTVPTAAERGGDFSAGDRVIVDPGTGQPFAGNQIPSNRLNSSALALLNLFPLPNQVGDTQNFHYVTTTTSHRDEISVRFVHQFGTLAQQRRRDGAGGAGGGFAAGGRPAGGLLRSNLNIGLQVRRSDVTNSTAFQSLGGTTTSMAWNVPVSLGTVARAGLMNMVRVQINRQRQDTRNLYAFGQDIAGEAGIAGASTDPFDWGAPTLLFSTLQQLHDVNGGTALNQTIAAGDSMVKTRGKHTFRFGGDYRFVRADIRRDSNARGNFVFTGLYSGLDFTDFLLGLTQQATVQHGRPSRFRAHTGDVYVQDDWRVASSMTINAGVRYEYFGPYSELANQMVTLDVPSDFSAAVAVNAGGTGPFSGRFPESITRPDRTAVAPRIGIAWKPQTATTVRAGYGINYNSASYLGIAQQLANQPPYVFTNTALGTLTNPLLLGSALTLVAPGSTTNTYAVDPDYRLGRLQLWNIDYQRDFARTVSIGIGYLGSKGSNLDIIRAPNRGPSGLRIAGVQPFLFESSEGESIMNGMSLRVRKRLTHGLAASAAYTLSKSIDNASSIGGSGSVVAQNDQDLAAERGLSSFDQRHRFNGNVTYELPFGTNKRWLNSGAAALWFGDWTVNGTIQLASGTPFTARVLSAISDAARGTNGTLRANYDGEPIQLDHPTAQQFFNINAFSAPPDVAFGNAGRNTIIGPDTKDVDLSITRNMTFDGNRGLSVSLTATNVLNTPQFATIDTVVNSKTFGSVLSVRPMRRVQLTMRFRF